VRELAEVWRGVRRADVFPRSVRQTLKAAGGRSAALVDPRPLRDLVRDNLPFDRIENAPWPLAVVTTDVMTGQEVVLTSGDAVAAVLASGAIPSIFPPVELDGHLLMDGGVVDNAPISAARALGADVIYVLPTGYACALEEPPRSALGAALHAVSIALQRRLVSEVAELQDCMDLRVAPPLCPVTIGPTDFRHSAELIERARASTRAWLDRPPVRDQTTYLGFHHHGVAVPSARQLPVSVRPTSGGSSRQAAASTSRSASTSA
jgi:NTE family protein